MQYVANRLNSWSRYITPLRTFPAFSASAKVLWGVILLNPFTHVFENSRSYEAMSRIFFFLTTYQSENTWGLIFFLLGSIHLITIIRNWKKVRFIIGNMSIGFWVFLATTFILYNPSLASPYFYFFIAFYEFLYTRKDVDAWFQAS